MSISLSREHIQPGLKAETLFEIADSRSFIDIRSIGRRYRIVCSSAFFKDFQDPAFGGWRFPIDEVVLRPIVPFCFLFGDPPRRIARHPCFSVLFFILKDAFFFELLGGKEEESGTVLYVYPQSIEITCFIWAFASRFLDISSVFYDFRHILLCKYQSHPYLNDR